MGRRRSFSSHGTWYINIINKIAFLRTGPVIPLEKRSNINNPKQCQIIPEVADIFASAI